MLSLYVQSSGDFLKIPISVGHCVIPRNIISMVFLWGAFTFNGVDLSSLKKLKNFRALGGDIVVLPKFPKNIEYIVLKDNRTKISGLSKKEVPEEWKEAKREKTYNKIIESI